jgi:prepilin-type N-terminal cleavage/methylation domain-containing protein
MQHGRRPEQGFSLVEVIIAIGVLSGVLVAISSMFMLGGRQVKVGKTITSATAIAHDIVERFENRSFNTLWADLGAAGTDSTRTVNSTTTGSPLAPWQAEIAQKLANGSASLTITALGPGTPTFATATAIRIRTAVTWNELGRPQTVTLQTVKF